jgi:hypothetical protein
VRLLTQAILPLELNVIEALAVIVALAALALSARLWRWTRADLATVFLLLTPVLVLSVAETTQFMTMDEWGLSMMMLDPSDRLVHQIMLGVLRTGGLIQLVLAQILQRWIADPDLIRMLLKAVWWLVGNSLLFAIAINVLRLAGLSPRRSAVPLAATYAALVLLPTSQLAIKTLNYDLFSMALGVLAILVALRAFEEKRETLLVGALLTAAFGAQEKLTVGPVLIVLVVLWALWRAIPVKDARSRIWTAMRWTVVGLVIPLGISLGSLALLAGFVLPAVPEGFFAIAADPLFSWTWVPFHLFMPIDVILAHRLMVAMTGSVVIILFAGIAAALAPSLISFWRDHKVADWFASPALPIFVLLTVLIVGVLTAITVVPYWAPFHPSSLPSLGQALNGVSLHLGATSVAGHYAGLVVYAVAVVVVAIPTSLWLVVGLRASTALLPTWFGGHSEDKQNVNRNATILILVGLVIPIATALAGIPFAHRYFNIAICVLGCAIILLGLQLIPTIASKTLATTTILILTGVLVVEVWPFRPLFAAFRPFWLSYGDADHAEAGRINASWMGWGEEILRIGKQVDRACEAGDARFGGIPCSEVTLNVMISGRWLPGPTSIKLKAFGEPKLDERTFVVLSRLYLIQNMYNIPAIKPDFVASYRGYVLAWAFRGDRLAASGYHLK